MRFIIIFAVAFVVSGAQANDLEKCRAKLKSAQKLDVLYAMEWKKGQQPHVVAGRTYYQMPFDGKEGFADTVNCFLTGGDNPRSCINFDIKHWQTGKASETYRFCRLKPK